MKKSRQKQVECADENGAVFVEFEFTWWTRRTASRRSCARRKDGRYPSGEKELEQVTCESDAKLDKNHEHSSGMQESIEADGTEDRVLALHTCARRVESLPWRKDMTSRVTLLR